MSKWWNEKEQAESGSLNDFALAIVLVLALAAIVIWG